MDNKMGTENGRTTERFSQQGQPGQSGNGGNPLGRNIPPEGRSIEEDESRSTFRRLNRYGQRGGFREASGESLYGRAPQYSERQDWDSARTGYGREYAREPSRYEPSRGRQSYSEQRGYPDQTIGTDRNRERQWDNRALDSVENEGDISGFRRSQYGERDPREEARQEQRGRFSSWWRREALTVSDVMTKNVKTVSPEASARAIAEIMRQEDVGVVPVVRPDGRLFGLATDRDIVVRGLAQGKNLDECRAQDLATKDLEVASPDDELSEILDLMGRQQIRRVPVVDENDVLVGIVSLGDIANRADQHDDLQRALERISGRRSFWSRIWR